MVQIIFDEN